MIRNKEVIKSLRELWKQHPKLHRQERKKSGQKKKGDYHGIGGRQPGNSARVEQTWQN